MLYEEARVYLDHVSKYGSVLGLDSIKSLLGELGNPQKDLKFIHIAGTNGKGSILAGLSGILQQAGYRTGRYCSPTVMGYMERFQVDGQWMAEDELAPFVSQVKEAAEKVLSHPPDYTEKVHRHIPHFLHLPLLPDKYNPCHAFPLHSASPSNRNGGRCGMWPVAASVGNHTVCFPSPIA